VSVTDWPRFLRNLIRTPVLTGAVSPSGKALARLMASHVDPRSTAPVLELGPGTGPVTTALIEQGIRPERIYAIEYSQDFCALLRQRFPRVHVVQGDAYDLPRTLRGVVQPPFAAAVSSLPLMTLQPEARRVFVEEVLGWLEPGAPVIQFSYSPTPPVTGLGRRVQVDQSGWVFRNLPPARVWTYRLAG
jgi:phosphatidylethanolamine/phosphatidyl-N-methylethanolamine N-methyltransferase